jgi:hypothetical protein
MRTVLEHQICCNGKPAYACYPSKTNFLIGGINSCGSETLTIKYKTTWAKVFLLGPISCPRGICDAIEWETGEV